MSLRAGGRERRGERLWGGRMERIQGVGCEGAG